MQIILLEKVVNLGNLGDVVKVKDGYARNFLIPTKRARRATDAAIKEFENRRAELERAAADKLAAAQALAEQLPVNRRYLGDLHYAGSGEIGFAFFQQDVHAGPVLIFIFFHGSFRGTGDVIVCPGIIGEICRVGNRDFVALEAAQAPVLGRKASSLRPLRQTSTVLPSCPITPAGSRRE